MTECILWDGPTFETHGNTYGRLKGSKMILAHRAAYEAKYGPIEKDKVIDHLCRNGLCINLEHLQAVSNVENVMRGMGAPAKNARKTHCPRNHELAGSNLLNRKNGKRECRECNRVRQLKTS